MPVKPPLTLKLPAVNIGIIPNSENSNCGPFNGSTSCSSPRPIEYELDHTNIGLLSRSGLGKALNALLNMVCVLPVV